MNHSTRDPNGMRAIAGNGRLFQALAFLVVLALPVMGSAQPKATEFGFKNQEAKGTRGLLVILIQDPKLNPLAHNAKRYDDLMFSNGSRHFLNRYIAIMSDRRFSYYKAGIVGPYSVSRKDNKGNDRSSEDIRNEAIRLAAVKDVDFSKFDMNKDKVVSTSELTIMVIDNFNDTGAQTDGGRNLDIPAQKVRVQSAVSHLAHRESLMTMCHELLHTIGGHDIYGWASRGMINRRISLFGPTTFGNDGTETFYLDPWHRMQFGWVEPTIRDMRVDGSIELRVPQLVENVPTLPPPPLILYDSEKGTKEFFILEYRNGAAGPNKTNYDMDVPSYGLSIWHVAHGADKKLFLMDYEVKPDPTKKIWTLYNRGAPDWNQGGNKLYTKEDGEILLRWMDRSESGVRVKVNSPAMGDKLSVSWKNDQPDPRLKPYATVTLKAGFLPDPFTRKVIAGGNAHTKLGGVKTHVSRAADLRLHYTAGTSALRIYALSKGDTTLLVNLPNGNWIANDDGGVGLNPQLNFANPQSGQYDIWVGTFGPKNVDATLYVSEYGASPTGMGIRVDVLAFTKRTTLVNSPRLFNELEEEWNNKRTKINNELQALLGTLNKKTPKGVNFVRQQSAVGTATITTKVGDSTGGFSVVKLMEVGVQVNNNSMRFRLTQPTILGSDADPEFLVTYDLRGRVVVPVSDSAKRLTVSKASFEVHNVKIDPRNTAARVVTFFDKTWFDSHYKNLAEQTLSKNVDLAPKVNKLLEPINSKLATVPGEVKTRIDPGFIITLTPNAPGKKDEIIVK